jgi:VIT1/CCC1 family predicted Fe2+/Mn2+ transporter
MLDKESLKIVERAQKGEITEYFIYQLLAKKIKDSKNKEILLKIADDELKHYNFWKEITGKKIKANRLKLWFYYLVARIFGITFGIKLMERGEEDAQVTYGKICDSIPGVKNIIEDEDEHEKQLIQLIEEERLKYVGSIVLGLSDALVELLGALAGLTFAFQNSRLVAIAGLITGIAASFSMAASEYLSIKSEGEGKKPFKASFYTGTAYIITVALLIFPYLLLSNLYLCLGISISFAILIILFFTFYISVAKDVPFKKRFLEMVSISLGVAALSFLIGVLIRVFLKIEV